MTKNRIEMINIRKSTFSLLFTTLGALLAGIGGAVVGFILGFVLDENFN